MAIFYNPNTYEIGSSDPIDSRFKRQTNAIRDTIPTSVRYEGLLVYVADPAGDSSVSGTYYSLVGGIANTNWVATSSIGAFWQLDGTIKNIGAQDVEITTKLAVPTVRPIINGTSAIKFTKADGTTVLMAIDTTNSRIGIGNSGATENAMLTLTHEGTGSALTITKAKRNTATIVLNPLEVGDPTLHITIKTASVDIETTVASKAIKLVTTGGYLILDGLGRTGLGIAPTATLHLKAGSADAETAPLKFTSGALLTTPEPGAIEFLSDAYYATITTGGVRKQLAFSATTLSGYGITNGVRNDTNGSINGTIGVLGITIDTSLTPKLTIKHDYVSSPNATSLILYTDESNAVLGSIGLAATTKAFTITSAASTPLIVLSNSTLAMDGVKFVDSSAYITKDVDGSLSFTDAVSGTKKLSELLAAHVWAISANDIYSNNTGNVGIGGAPTTGYKADIRGALRITGKILSAQTGSDSIEIESKSASGYDFRIYNVAKTVNRIYIDSNGYVGINTNSQVDQFGVVSTTAGIYAANLSNTNALGKGLYIAGGSGTLPSLYVGNYQGTSLFEVLGTGTAKAKRIQFDITASPITNAEGLLQWNATDGTLDLGMLSGKITQQIGQEMFIKVINRSGATIPDGAPVYFNGRQGNRPKIYLAKSDSEITSAVQGITTDEILDGAEGFITTFGYVRQIKTNYSGWVEGQPLYVSKTVAGELTNVEPTAPHHSDVIGQIAIIGGAGIGAIFVNIDKHKTLTELSDVDGTPLASSGQLPVWDNTRNVFDFNYNINNYTPLGDLTKYQVDLNRFGFVTRTETQLSFDGIKTVTLAVAGTEWSYYRLGVRYTIFVNKTVDIAVSPVNGTLYYIYIDSNTGDLVSGSAWTLNDTKVPVATVYWDSTLTPKYVLCDERHTCKIDRAYHREHHFSDGTELSSAGTLTGLVPLSSNPGEKTFGVSGIQFYDEDLAFSPSALVDPDGATAVYYILYRTSATTYKWVLSDMPFKYGGTVGNYTHIEYDLNGTSTPMATNNRYCNTYVFVCNSVSNAEANPEITTAPTRYFIIQGRNFYTSAALAIAEKFTVSAGMPVAEGVAVYQLTWTNNGIAASVKGRCQFVSSQIVSANVISGNIVSTTLHNALTGIDGGSVGEYYHLTAAQYTALTPVIHDVTTSIYTITESSGVIYTLVSYAAGLCTITLPVATNNIARLVIKKNNSSANNTTIVPNGTDTIDGATQLDISVAKTTVTLIARGTNWEIV